MNASRRSTLAAALLMPVLSSCVIVTSGEQGKRETRLYLGVIKVNEPSPQETKGGVKMEELETLGLRVDRGFGFGYFHERTESIPFDNRIVIRVQSEEQYAHLLVILEKLALKEEQHPCVILEK